MIFDEAVLTNNDPFCDTCQAPAAFCLCGLTDMAGVLPDLSEVGVEVELVRCECGSEKVGSPTHSDWCPATAAL